MGREHIDKRTITETISNLFPGRWWLKTEEVAESMGIDTRTVRKRFSIQKGGIAVDTLIREYCSGR